MAKKITELPSTTTLAVGDLFVVVADPGGTPVTKKITFANLVAEVMAEILGGSGLGRTVTVNAVDPTTGDSVTLEFENGVLKV